MYGILLFISYINSIQIFFLVPPHVNSISPHDDYYLPLGSTISISCNISTLPGTTVSWYHNNTKLTGSGRILLTQPSSSIWSLTVFNAVFSDNGLYWCNVTNNYVFDFVSLQVIVGGKSENNLLNLMFMFYSS